MKNFQRWRRDRVIVDGENGMTQRLKSKKVELFSSGTLHLSLNDYYSLKPWVGYMVKTSLKFPLWALNCWMLCFCIWSDINQVTF